MQQQLNQTCIELAAGAHKLLQLGYGDAVEELVKLRGHGRDRSTAACWPAMF